MLRYGDGTPFPHDDGFLDMLVDAVEACTAMLGATANLERRRSDAEAVLQAIGEEERRLLMFERAVAAACVPAPDGKSTPAARAAERTRSAMASAVELSREQLRQISAVKAAPPSWHRTARRVHAAAARFFGRRLLPGTRWAWAWDASGVVPRGEAATQDARFRVVFDLDLPPAWSAPVRIDTLVPDLVVHLPRRRWLRRPVDTAIPLGRCLLVGARHDDRGRELVIRKPDGSGWRIELPQDGQPSALALDGRGRHCGTGLVGESELAPLIEAIDRELATQRLPRHARDVLLDGKRLTEIADTALPARALLGELAPTVLAIRQRSRMPGELTLKRDIANGLREEVYISRSSLTTRYASLPAEQRQLLDEAGFGRGLTADPAPPSRPSRPSSPPPVPPRTTSPAIAARASSPQLPSAASSTQLPTQPAPRSSAPSIPTIAERLPPPSLPSAASSTQLPTQPAPRTSAPSIPTYPSSPTIPGRPSSPTRTRLPRATPEHRREPRLPTEPSSSPRALAETVLVTAVPPAGLTPPPRRQTQPLQVVPARPSVPVLPIAPMPRPPADPEQAKRRREEPTIPSVVVVPAIHPRVEVQAELSEIVTPPPLFPRVPVRRLQTPTG